MKIPCSGPSSIRFRIIFSPDSNYCELPWGAGIECLECNAPKDVPAAAGAAGQSRAGENAPKMTVIQTQTRRHKRQAVKGERGGRDFPTVWRLPSLVKEIITPPGRGIMGISSPEGVLMLPKGSINTPSGLEISHEP